MRNISVVFNAENGQFVSGVDGMDKSIAKASERVAQAKNAILAWGKSSVQSAQEAGASSERLAAIQERTAQRLASVTEQNATKVVNALERQAAKAREVANELKNLNKVVDTSGSISDEFSKRQQSAAVLRSLSGRSSLRTGEAFASAIPGFAALAEVVFPVAGAIAFATVIAEGVSHLKEMYDTAKKIPDAIRDGWEQLNEPIQLNVDTLRKDNDQLEITIAHLEHKPANTLALGIDEARIAADKLAESSRKALNDVTKLMQENHVGFKEFVLTGQVGTSGYEDEIKKRMQSIRDLEQANRDALHTSTDTPEAAAKRSAQLRQQYKDDYEWAKKERAGLQSFDTQGKTAGIQQDLIGFQNYSSDSFDLMDETARNVQDQGKVKQLQSAKELAGDTNKAKEQQLKALENYVNVWKTMAPVSAKALYDFWEAQKAGFASAPQQLEAINTKLAELATSGAEKAHSLIEKYKTLAKEASKEIFTDKPVDVTGNTAESARGLHNAQEEVAKTQTKLRAEYAKTRVEIDLANGSITKQTADERLAAIAAGEHAQRMDELQTELSQFQKNAKSYNPVLGLYTNDKEQERYIQITGEMSKEAAQQSIDAMKDAASVAADTWQQSLTTAFDKWLIHARDTSAQVSELFGQGINGLNDNLTNLLTGDYKRGDFKRYGQGLFKTTTSDLLQQGESRLLGSFGIQTGKPDGSKGKPLHVIVDSGVPGGSTASGLSKLFNNSDSDSSDSSDSSQGGFGGFLSKTIGIASSLFGGGHAVGGDLSVGHVYQINENGQELFAPSMNGRMIPHGQTVGGGGGAVYYSVNVANGVTPEQMKMHVQTALQEYHPHAVQASVAAIQAHQNRRPQSSR